jgi:UDP-N-acetylglucosamine 2-epimerase
MFIGRIRAGLNQHLETSMITVLSIVGTWSEAIKMAPVVRALSKHPGKIRSVVCSTGQHRRAVDHILKLFHITPDYELNLTAHNPSLAILTSNLCVSLDTIIDVVQPDWILAQGDTTTALVAALLAYSHQVKFGHVEAGLRSDDRFDPFPEEMNRRIADVLADVYFVPTESARRALLRENVRDARIYVTGNTIVDALEEVAAIPYDATQGLLAAIPDDKARVLVMAHRGEHHGDPLREICEAVRDMAWDWHEQVHFIYPLDRLDIVQETAREILSSTPGVSLIDPLDYLTLVNLMKSSALILTDSGGIQEEATILGVPFLVLRNQTERPEAIDMGLARLVGTQRERIIEAATAWIKNPPAHRVWHGNNPFGDGRATGRIIQVMLDQV